jgi:hypothetical protein
MMAIQETPIYRPVPCLDGTVATESGTFQCEAPAHRAQQHCRKAQASPSLQVLRVYPSRLQQRANILDVNPMPVRDNFR